MVQVIENRADLTGHVLSVAEHEKLAGHARAVIAVEAISAVDGYANMFGTAVGSRLEVVVASTRARGLRVGDEVRLRIRRAGPSTVFGE